VTAGVLLKLTMMIDAAQLVLNLIILFYIIE
jgi:hypothetical protein